MAEVAKGNPRLAVIGSGLMGYKRVSNLPKDVSVTVCCDTDRAKAEALARITPNAEVSVDWQSVVRSSDVDAVLVCTPHDLLAEIALAAVENRKDVLLEKPGARRTAELGPVESKAAGTGVLVRVGFNHRYHRAFRKAREIFDSGQLGDLLFIRGRYGHGGRPGYEREWRAVPERAGGGEAVDQGTHLLDLAHWFAGDLKYIAGRAPTYFWNMPVEDNAFFLLESDSGQVVQLHASWTEWKNLFSFEICGRYGKLEIAGLGGSYGTERLIHYQMESTMGPPATTIYEYPKSDDSWSAELTEFVEDIRLRRSPRPGIRDAQAALRIIEHLYNEI